MRRSYQHHRSFGAMSAAKKKAPAKKPAEKVGGKSFQVGDRVERVLPGAKQKYTGVIEKLEEGYDNSGRPKPAARVRWDHESKDEWIYSYLYAELKKLNGMSLRGTGRISGLSGAGWSPLTVLGTLVAVGAVAFAMWPKKAKAAELPKDSGAGAGAGAGSAAVAEIPVGAETGAEKTVTPGATVTVSKDPGSGVTIAGPTGTIAAGVKRTVAKGESWSNIASRTYGDYRWWPFLWDSNRMGTQYQDPSLLRVGDEIMVPTKPTDVAFKVAIFARAEADRAWEVAKNKAKAAGKPFSTPRPASTFAATPLPGKTALKGQVFAQSAASSVSTAPGYGGYSMPYQG